VFVEKVCDFADEFGREVGELHFCEV